ncbi:MAG: serine/threonine-protein kinase [Acidobacteriota bacterium]|nr:serine/threonine protein kinase [Blastocatellia bacterium]MDW8411570.1 serine/threonine-protein kinase [Acidobacteriota bacterium]
MTMVECSTCHRSFKNRLSHCPYDGTPLIRDTTADDARYIGKILDGKYLILSKIGEGGMCNVYRGQFLSDTRPCAVKILHSTLNSDQVALRRFQQEIRTARLIKHQNVVEVYDYGETSDGTVYMVMELIIGPTLKQLLQSGPLPLQRASSILRQICAALEAAHSQGIIHRDLKPDNIMLVNSTQDSEVVKILDFGIAKFYGDTSITAEITPHIVMGTPRYMSPEQCHGKPLDSRSDIYAVGLLAYEMLTGSPPFTDTSAQVLMSKHMNEPVPSMKQLQPSIPSAVEKVVLKALEKSPLKRYQRPIDFIEEFEEAITQDPSVVPSVVHRPQPKSELIPVVKKVGELSIVEYTTGAQKRRSLPLIYEHFYKHSKTYLLSLVVAILVAIIILFFMLFSEIS